MYLYLEILVNNFKRVIYVETCKNMFSFIVICLPIGYIVYFLNSLIVILSHDVQVFLINIYTNLFQYLVQLIHFFTLQECGLYICNEKWSSENVRHYYNVALLVLQYCIPFAVLLFTYVNIGVVVWGKRTPGEAQNSRDVRMAKSKRKVIFSTNYDFYICNALFSIFTDDKNDGDCGNSIHSLLAAI